MARTETAAPEGCPHFPFPRQDVLPEGRTAFPSGHDPLGLSPQYGGLPPITKVVLPEGQEAHLVTGYAECLRVLREHDTFRRADADGIHPYPTIGSTILAMDGAEHRAVRNLVGNYFAPANVGSLRPRVEGLASALVEEMLAEQGPVELLGRLAKPLTLGVIGHIMGVPDTDLPQFATWGDMFLAAGPDRAEQNQLAMGGMVAYMGRRIEAILSSPADHAGPPGLITAIAGNQAQNQVPMDQAVIFAASMVIAGWETTAAALGSFMYRLLTATGDDGDTLYQQLCTYPDRISTAVEELMRTIPNSMFDTTQPRRAVRDVQLGDTSIRKGDLVLAGIDHADRDPRKFDEPDRIDFERSTAQAHLGFGAGPHVCLGAPLARLELNVALEHLTARAPAARLHEPPHEVRWNISTTIRRPVELWLELPG
ncbi:cytochrome P450 [Actinomadura violacea]|uniref:Cytochrome P450 n=1 Tax=Actinomadura violacea TaxID=2819934 RepID=A0ABS3RLB9_9ACTN|nr:cytochrome P450 [Actinomadura violacea]MBO2457534.1 cytochrome P450 [Actinomadura violacea]